MSLFLFCNDFIIFLPTIGQLACYQDPSTVSSFRPVNEPGLGIEDSDHFSGHCIDRTGVLTKDGQCSFCTTGQVHRKNRPQTLVVDEFMTLYSPFDSSSLPMLHPLLCTSTRLSPLRPYSNTVLARMLHPPINYGNPSPRWFVKLPESGKENDDSPEKQSAATIRQ